MKTTIIGVAGGTASGKTTLASKLYMESKKYGSVSVIRVDDYYKCLDHLSMDDRKKINFDHPNAYDVELLITHLNNLKNGISINKPTYDFTKHTRSSYVEVVNPCNVIIVEGIMAFAIPELRDMFDIKVFVDTPDDIRFIRRLKRDINERGREMDAVIEQYLSTVKPMFNKYVSPSSRHADIIIPNDNKHDVAVDFLVAKIKDILNSND